MSDGVTSIGRTQGQGSRGARLATTGLVTTLASPALMHAMKGHLHNLTLLTELLQRETATTRDPDALRASAGKRTKTIRLELEAMHRHLGLMEGLAEWSDRPGEAFCDVHACLPDVLQAARVEAARRRVQLRADVMPEPALVLCPTGAFQQVVLTCTIHTIRRCRAGESVVVSAEAAEDATVFHFLSGELTDADDASDRELDLALLAQLAELAGARFTPQPTLRVAFRNASH